MGKTIGYVAESYDDLYMREQLNKLNIIIDELNLKNSDRVLDLGCATGFTLNYYPCRVVGVEPQQSLIDHKSTIKNIIKGFAEDIPFKDKEFTHTIVLSAVHHFNLERSFMEIRRVTEKIVVFTIVKGLPSENVLFRKIQENFKVKKIINEKKDKIVFCNL